MVRTGLVLRALLIASTWVNAQLVVAAALQITAESSTVELGKPVWLTLTSDQTAQSLTTLDFTPWQRDFVLPRVDDASVSEDGRSQVLRLRLFPLRKGSFTLPALQFLNHYSAEIEVRVTDAIDPKNHAPIDFSYTISTQSPWQQQQVLVTCLVRSRDEHAVFEQAAESQTGVQLLPMQIQHTSLYHSKEHITRYTLGWVVIPSRAGQQHLRLPPIQYLRDGVVTHKFYLPPLMLEVQALPTWLPGTVPVGQVEVATYSLPAQLLSTSVLSELKLQLHLTGVAPGLLPAYEQQLRSDSSLQFYAAQQQTLATIDANGIKHQLNYTVPLIPRRMGVHRLPALRLQYFEPDSGTLQTFQVEGPRVLILGTWLQVLLLLGLAGLLIWTARHVQRRIVYFWQRYRTYQQALQRLNQSNSLADVKQVMQLIAQAEGWRSNLTYQQWQARMQALTPVAKELAVSKLNAAVYGRQEMEISALVHPLMRICQQRRLVFL